MFVEELKVEQKLAKAKPIKEYDFTIEELEKEQEEITSKLDAEAALRLKGWFILDKTAGELLLLAAEHGWINVIKYLINSMMPLTYSNFFGDTLLHYAAKGDDPKMIVYLIK